MYAMAFIRRTNLPLSLSLSLTHTHTPSPPIPKNQWRIPLPGPCGIPLDGVAVRARKRVRETAAAVDADALMTWRAATKALEKDMKKKRAAFKREGGDEERTAEILRLRTIREDMALITEARRGDPQLIIELGKHTHELAGEMRKGFSWHDQIDAATVPMAVLPELLDHFRVTILNKVELEVAANDVALTWRNRPDLIDHRKFAKWLTNRVIYTGNDAGYDDEGRRPYELGMPGQNTLGRKFDLAKARLEMHYRVNRHERTEKRKLQLVARHQISRRAQATARMQARRLFRAGHPPRFQCRHEACSHPFVFAYEVDYHLQTRSLVMDALARRVVVMNRHVPLCSHANARAVVKAVFGAKAVGERSAAETFASRVKAKAQAAVVEKARERAALMGKAEAMDTLDTMAKGFHDAGVLEEKTRMHPATSALTKWERGHRQSFSHAHSFGAAKYVHELKGLAKEQVVRTQARARGWLARLAEGREKKGREKEGEEGDGAGRGDEGGGEGEETDEKVAGNDGFVKKGFSLLNSEYTTKEEDEDAETEGKT